MLETGCSQCEADRDMQWDSQCRQCIICSAVQLYVGGDLGRPVVLSEEVMTARVYNKSRGTKEVMGMYVCSLWEKENEARVAAHVEIWY